MAVERTDHSGWGTPLYVEGVSNSGYLSGRGGTGNGPAERGERQTEGGQRGEGRKDIVGVAEVREEDKD